MNLPDFNDARATLLRDAYARGVLDVLASRGYPARTEKQAADLLAIAERVRTMAPPAEKRAGDVYSELRGALDGLAAGPAVKAASERDAALDRYASALAEDPSIYNAVLAVKAAEADAYARQTRGA